MRKFFTLIIGCALFCSFGLLPSANAQDEFMGKVIDTMVAAVQDNYISVVEKLQRDGAGASTNYLSQPGFVPLPEDFMRRMAFDIFFKHKGSKQKEKFDFKVTAGLLGLRKMTATSLSEEEKALLIANIIDRIVRATRTTYATMVVRKLKRDGFGASLSYTSQKGFVPLPAVFIRQISSGVISKQQLSEEKETLFAFLVRSRWNLNAQNALRNNFELQGWKALAAQQENHLASGNPLKTIAWKPYVQTMQDKMYFLSADPASSQSCVACHNQWERKKEIQGFRNAQGVEVGKVFKRHELMGALSILVALNQ